MVQISTKTTIVSLIVALIVLAGAFWGTAYLSHDAGKEAVYKEQSETNIYTLVNSTGDHLEIHILALCEAIARDLVEQNAGN